MIAVLVAGLASIGVAYAADGDSDQGTITPRQYAGNTTMTCTDTYYASTVSGSRIAKPTLCHEQISSGSGYTNKISLNTAFPRQTGTLVIRGELGSPDPMVQSSIQSVRITFWKDDLIMRNLFLHSNPFVLEYHIEPGYADYFGTGSCGHAVSVLFNTGAGYDNKGLYNEARDKFDFCVLDANGRISWDPDPAPPLDPTTGVKGKVYQDANGNGRLDITDPGVEGREVIAVSLADHSDVSRTTTDANGDYAFELDPGGYLIQVIGGGSQGYAYVGISGEGVVMFVNLIP